MNAGARFLCIHGHFYQPPRENPWLEMVELQDGAAPYHDWNERITAECYAPNTAARILDQEGMVMGLLNNYAHMSFNVGPTLLSWLRTHAPQVARALLEADAESARTHHGHSNAMAQAYGHSILPLDRPRDRLTQVRWGIHAFRHFFGHRPEGMWLPETAVDVPTLEVLASEGILFTVLAPHQAARIRPLGKAQWTEVKGDLDVTRPYLCRLPSGRRIALFFYHGPVSRAVAFEGLLNDGESFYRRLLASFQPAEARAQLVHIATDGETYGHHHRFGEMALAYALHRALGDREVHLTNYGEFLEMAPPQWEVEIREATSWSCIHGLERWRSDCGCRVGGDPSWHQRWRAPLREALCWLKEALDEIFQEEGEGLLGDPWEARDSYIQVVLEPPGEAVEVFLDTKLIPKRDEALVSRSLKLLEMQRNGLLMFTSCGWFFNELSGIETTQVLLYAARAIQLARELGHDLEPSFLERLEKAPSNLSSFSNGRGVWEKKVLPSSVSLSKVVAQHGLRTLLKDKAPASEPPGFSVKQVQYRLESMGTAQVALGRVQVTCRRTLQRLDAIFGAIHFGGLDLTCFQKPCSSHEDWERVQIETRGCFQKHSVGELYAHMREQFPAPVYTLRDLPTDERRRLIRLILQDRFQDYIQTLDALAEHDLGMLEHLAAMAFPIPEPLVMAGTVYVNRRIERILEGLPEDGEALEDAQQLLTRSVCWGYKPDRERWAQLLTAQLHLALEGLAGDAGMRQRGLQSAELILEAAQRLGVSLNLWRAQNLLVESCEQRWYSFGTSLSQVEALARRMKIKENLLPWNRRQQGWPQ
ncbi:MAG: DUF3536 domain-containing protein [Thermodesulfobacteriota bacterium]